jgi:hypothetical protein
LADKTSKWTERLHDERSGSVVFLAHCLLNENTRYLGGAARPGSVGEVVTPCIEQGIGIVQLPCPEEHVWGGVLKRRLLAFYGAHATVSFRLRAVLFPLMLLYTRLGTDGWPVKSRIRCRTTWRLVSMFSESSGSTSRRHAVCRRR